MTQQISIKDAIASIPSLKEDTSPMIDFMRAWMIITGLDFKDVVHLSHKELVQGLGRVSSKLSDSVDIFDDDQLQEAACRCLGKITVYGDPVGEGDIVLSHGQDVSWDGSTWNYVSDPKMRLRETSKHYLNAIAAVKDRVET